MTWNPCSSPRETEAGKRGNLVLAVSIGAIVSGQCGCCRHQCEGKKEGLSEREEKGIVSELVHPYPQAGRHYRRFLECRFEICQTGQLSQFPSFSFSRDDGDKPHCSLSRSPWLMTPQNSVLSFRFELVFHYRGLALYCFPQ